ncbi:MAG: hypothetical protein AAGC44_06190 [Planctomycetota bacterium]
MNWLCLLAILLTGCRSSEYLQSIDKPDWHWTVSDDVRSAWLEHRSYYALIEIIDTELVLHGNQIDHHPTRKDVETALGKGHQPLHYLEWEDIDTCPVWQYSSRRKVSSGSYVSFRFNENDRVVEMQWYSE